jgi:F0F1-type ATP synthase membrane subunit c/vacuolar-type H+-ATPase subunit K
MPGGGVMPSGGYHQPMVQGGGPIGKVRGTGVSILLMVVTLGIYTLVWYYSVHSEMKRHRGTGLGGGLALLLTIVVGIVMPYVTSSEVGSMYEMRGQPKPVSGMTGLWYFPGLLLIIGPIVWFVKTNGALNAYWRACGAR